MNKNVFNWAFIGAGRIARSVASRIAENGEHRVAAVYTRTYDRAAEFAARFGGKACKSLEDAVGSPEADGVYINVTNDAHFALCLRALELGKPVLMEKPFTTDAQQARRLFEVARASGVYLCEAMWTWFSEQARAVENAVKSGAVGDVTGGTIAFCLPIAFGKNNRLLSSGKAGGALLDMGVYPVTYAYRLFGVPRRISCRAKFKHGVDMCDNIVFGYDGFDVNIKTSVRSTVGGGVTGEKLAISGSDGRIVAHAFHSGGDVKIISRGDVTRIPGDKNLMRTQFDRVADEIRAGKKNSDFVPPEQTIAVMDILDEIRRQTGLKFSFER